MGTEQEKDVEVSEEDIRREMGSWAEDEVRDKTKKFRSRGDWKPQGLRILCSIASVGV